MTIRQLGVAAHSIVSPPPLSTRVQAACPDAKLWQGPRITDQATLITCLSGCDAEARHVRLPASGSRSRRDPHADGGGCHPGLDRQRAGRLGRARRQLNSGSRRGSRGLPCSASAIPSYPQLSSMLAASVPDGLYV